MQFLSAFLTLKPLAESKRTTKYLFCDREMRLPISTDLNPDQPFQQFLFFVLTLSEVRKKYLSDWFSKVIKSFWEKRKVNIYVSDLLFGSTEIWLADFLRILKYDWSKFSINQNVDKRSVISVFHTHPF